MDKSETATKLTFTIPAYLVTVVGPKTIVLYDSNTTANATFSVGGNLQLSPTTLNFSYSQRGATPASQTVALSTDSFPISGYTVAIPSTSPWLSITPANGSVPGTITASVNPTGLNPGTYTASVTITASTAANTPVTLPVIFTVGQPPSLQSTPTQLSFTSQQNASAPASQTLSVTTGTATGVPYSVTAATTNNGTWLTASPSSGTTAGTITVSVNPAGLTPGSYAGEVLITSSAVDNSPLIIPVGFTITGQPSIVPAPTSLSFSYQTGGTTPSAQSVAIASSGAAFSYTAAVSTTAGGTWLTASATSGTTPGSLNVSVNPSGLAAGTYSGQVTITSAGTANTPLAIPVTLTVVAQPSLVTVPQQITISYTSGSPNPTASSLPITASNGAAVAYTAVASGATWLSITGTSGTTPGAVTVNVTPSGMALGSYSGIITITAAGMLNSPLTVPVTLLVVAPQPPGPPLTVSPSQLTFTASAGATPPTQTLSATSTATIAVSSATGGGSWLIATSSSTTTPATITVSANPTGLANGTYNGVVVLYGGSSPVQIPVTMTISPTPALIVSPTAMQFISFAGAPAPLPQLLSVSSGQGTSALSYSIANTNAAWLTVLPASGSTPSSSVVSVDPTGLSAGTYNASITVTSNGPGAPSVIPITLTIKASSDLFTSPSQLTFNATTGVTPPAAQSVSVFSTNAGTHFTSSVSTENGGTWVVAGGAAVTPGNIVVSVSAAGLAPGTYQGQLTISSADNTAEGINVPITLNVATAASSKLVASPQSLQLNYSPSSGAASQRILVLNSGDGALSYSSAATTQSCGNWLTLTGASGSATAKSPGIQAFTVNPGSLAPQTCTGQITISADSGANVIPVTMTINPEAQSISLSQTALNFTAVAGGPVPAPQTFFALNPGTSSMNWSTSIKTLTGGNWLSATPSAGTSPAGSSPATPVSVSVNPQGLAPGTYYGNVSIAAPGAGNGPKLVTVALTVAPPGSPAIQVTPAGLIFSGTSPQSVTLTNSSSSPLTYMSAAYTDDGGPWLSLSPASGTVPAAGSLTVSVQVMTQGLSAGLRHGILRAGFSDGSAQSIDIVLTNGGVSAAANSLRPQLVIPGCSSNNLALVFQSPAPDFAIAARIPVPIQVLAEDCTGTPVTSNALVSALIDGSDIPLQHIGSGVWTGTWTPAVAETIAALEAHAVLFQSASGRQATGSIVIHGAVQTADPAAPGVVTNIVNAASFQNPSVVAPGAWISIFGSGLAQGSGLAPSAPFPSAMMGTQFQINGQPLPLYFVSDSQVNALVPSGVSSNERPQLLVYRNGTLSAGIDVTIAGATPAVFTTSQQGSGQGTILVASTNALAGPAGQPAHPGDAIQIFCTGLGAVTNPPLDGAPAGASPLSLTAITPDVMVGSSKAIVSFAGLAPGQVGVYQINAQVPADALPGDAVPVTVTVGNFVSNTVTIAVQ